MILRRLERGASNSLKLLWDDNEEQTVKLKAIRDACPCANCKGETVLLEHFGPPPIDYDAPGRYDLKAVEQVGNYALRFSWGDGHTDGIYPFPVLRALGDCAVYGCPDSDGTNAGNKEHDNLQ